MEVPFIPAEILAEIVLSPHGNIESDREAAEALDALRASGIEVRRSDLPYRI